MRVRNETDARSDRFVLFTESDNGSLALRLFKHELPVVPLLGDARVVRYQSWLRSIRYEKGFWKRNVEYSMAIADQSYVLPDHCQRTVESFAKTGIPQVRFDNADEVVVAHPVEAYDFVVRDYQPGLSLFEPARIIVDVAPRLAGFKHAPEELGSRLVRRQHLPDQWMMQVGATNLDQMCHHCNRSAILQCANGRRLSVIFNSLWEKNLTGSLFAARSSDMRSGLFFEPYGSGALPEYARSSLKSL